MSSWERVAGVLGQLASLQKWYEGCSRNHDDVRSPDNGAKSSSTMAPEKSVTPALGSSAKDVYVGIKKVHLTDTK